MAVRGGASMVGLGPPATAWVAGIDAPFASAWPGAPVDDRWLDSSWSWADTAACGVLLAAVASRRWLFAAGFAAGSALTAWRAAEMFRR